MKTIKEITISVTWIDEELHEQTTDEIFKGHQAYVVADNWLSTLISSLAK